jgi:hypothetical protein
MHARKVVSLIQNTAYVFDVCAVNEIGQSPFSSGTTVQTLTPKKNLSNQATSASLAMANGLADAWMKKWDPKTEQYFYFNRITGTRYGLSVRVTMKLQASIS